MAPTARRTVLVCAALAVCNVLLGSAAGAQDVSFLPSRNMAAGTNPTAVAVGDFNGDGVPDIVVALHGSTFSVFLGIGDGSFHPPMSFAAGPIPISIAVADFDRDGRLDLVVANSGSDVSLFLGNGDGTFQPRRAVLAGSKATSVAVGDFNRDGVPDLVVGRAEDAFIGNVSVLLGNGDGTFQPPASLGRGEPVHFVAVGDFDGDGVPDLALARSPTCCTGQVWVFLGLGDGTFNNYPWVVEMNRPSSRGRRTSRRKRAATGTMGWPAIPSSSCRKAKAGSHRLLNTAFRSAWNSPFLSVKPCY